MQLVTSAKTSRNQLPAGAKKIEWQKATVNFDYGSGKYEKMTEYLKEQGVYNIKYDPFNLSKKENQDALDYAKENYIDSLTCFNVLNVIADKESREKVISHCYEVLNNTGMAYFQMYEGDKTGTGKKTRDGFQNNMRARNYFPEIREIFKNRRFIIL